MVSLKGAYADSQRKVFECVQPSNHLQRVGFAALELDSNGQTGKMQVSLNGSQFDSKAQGFMRFHVYGPVTFVKQFSNTQGIYELNYSGGTYSLLGVGADSMVSLSFSSARESFYFTTVCFEEK